MAVNKNTRKALHKYGKNLIADAKRNLAQHNVSGELNRSLRYKITEVDGRLQLQVFMLDYGDVLDKGLSGYKVNRPNTKYQARSSRVLGRKGVFGNIVGVDWLDVRRWTVERGIRFSGQSKNQTAFLVHRSIKWRGFRGTKWFSRSKEKTQSTLRKAIAKSSAKDMLSMIKLSTQKMK